MSKQSGTVKWFDNAKGYGFLITPDIDEDVFVHHKEIQMDGYRTLKEGERVSFKLTSGEQGYQAAEVVRA